MIDFAQNPANAMLMVFGGMFIIFSALIAIDEWLRRRK